MRKESRRNCDRFGECGGVVFIIKTIGSSVGCVKPFVHGLPCAKRVRWSSEGRRPNDLTRMQACASPPDNVNIIFSRSTSAKCGQPPGEFNRTLADAPLNLFCPLVNRHRRFTARGVLLGLSACYEKKYFTCCLNSDRRLRPSHVLI